MSSLANGSMFKVAAALAAILVVVVAILIFTNAQPQPGGIGCLFYSADSTPSGYTVYATVLNNHTSPVSVERVFFDGAEQAYSENFVEGVSGIWSMEAGYGPTKILGSREVGTIYLRVAAAGPGTNHTVKVVTNTTSFEFGVVARQSSLRFDGYDFVQAPGFEYVLVNISNTGTATGFVVEVAMDGEAYAYNGTSAPTKTASTWSMLVEGRHSQAIGVGQQGMVYIDTLAICHSCTHMVKVRCSDGSYVEFSFKTW